ncbi:anthranilate 1,2-dioxygenase electron transfer component AntC [Stutzerimonas tarimensis]|uniref:Anthranilate 1,2-dioxygenase electron transfer component AntC n=1 Tax=Stutzerimonas tarimensis TaxID=1507735 RepID=A0ABV7T6L0_9GAMM
MSLKVAFSFADGKTLFFPVKENEILLDAALRNGIKLPLDCREGVCGTCQGRCESGRYSQEYVDEEALSAADLAQGKVLTCQTRVQSDATFYFDFASSLCSQADPTPLTGVVTAVRQVSPSTAILELDASGNQPLDFLPGQYARLQVPGTATSRAYSFANQPNGDNRLEFLIRLLPDGAMSNYIRERCRPGDQIALEAPLGAFYLRQADRPLVMVAGGTGLSAFLGMLDQLTERGCEQPIRLYYGVRHSTDLCALERIAGYGERLADFRFVPVVSGPDEHWDGRRGYVTEHFDLAALSETPFDLYVCGPPPMVESTRNWLSEKVSSAGQLYYEKFTDSSTSQAEPAHP